MIKNNLLALQEFCSKNKLKDTIKSIEMSLKGCSKIDLKKKNIINNDLLAIAFEVKKIVGPIDILIHAWGILSSLPYILESNETIESLSLGAGNTGKPFDIETDKRVAEFKFISWKGGPESIRQNSIFIDFMNLAECKKDKNRYLYVIDKQIPLKFFNSKRAINGVLSKNASAHKKFYGKYKNQYSVVSEYYNDNKKLVKIVDLRELVPEIFDLK